MARTPISDFFGIELPIIQSPMAGVQGSALAIAVSQAGGLGSLPCAILSPDQIRAEVKAITAASSKPYNVNFFVHQDPRPEPAREAAWRKTLAPYYAELGVDPASITPGPPRLSFTHDAADVLEVFKPPVVSFHFGLPAGDLMTRVKSWGSKIISTATTVEEALYLEAHGADAVIAQGFEAGGHRGMFLTTDLNTQAGTMALVPQLVNAIKVPVIAGGGIAEGRSVQAAIRLGAAGAQVGTAFLLCPETLTSPLHRAALKSDAARVTALTNIFTGRLARAIVNRIVRELGAIHPAAPAFPLAASAMMPLRQKAESRGSSDFSSLWAGQNAPLCRDVPAAALTKQLAAS
jgi:nitronate monooxygenase